MSVSQIRDRLQSIIDYMKPYWYLVNNAHMVNYITDNHWDKLPSNLKQEIYTTADASRCIGEVFCKSPYREQHFPELHTFLISAENHRLENFTEIVCTPQDIYEQYGIQSEFISSIKEFMSMKKRHEVEITAQFVHTLISHHNISKEPNVMIIDAGDGKGYLSTRLALEYNYKIIGIDRNEGNTQNAILRGRKLKRVWRSLCDKADHPPIVLTENEEISDSPTNNRLKVEKSCSRDIPNYKTVAKSITPNLDIIDLSRSLYELDVSSKLGVCIVGLHTCGNLAPTNLRLYHNQPSCAIICNIACCFHLLTEKYSNDEPYSNPSLIGEDPGFPMSDFLHAKQFKLSRNVRMLATQSVDRTMDSKQYSNISLFYRAMLQTMLPKNIQTHKVGKIRKYTSFSDYIEKSGAQIDSSLDLNAIESSYKHHYEFMNLFYLIRMQFAPIIESIILLDQLLYLKENGFSKSFVVSLFNPVISPRHYAIVSMR